MHEQDAPQDPEELLQIVDKDDNPIGTETRELVHAKGLLHRAVHILVFNPKGDLYLQRRSAGKDLWPGYWSSSCAGHVGAGESYAQAAKRELKEELGIEKTPDEIGRLTPSPKSENQFIRVYAFAYEGEITPSPSEIDEARFFSIDQIRAELISGSRPFAPTFTAAFRLWASSSPTYFGEG
jgi:isopentenyl-diphosphate delta-isomerase